MKNDEKGMNLHKKKGLELSDQDLDAVTGGLLYTIRNRYTEDFCATVAGLKALKKWLAENSPDGSRGFKVDIVGRWILSDKKHLSLLEKIQSMPGVYSVY